MAAIDAGRAAGSEDEFGAERGLSGEPTALAEDEQAPIETFAQLHATAGVGAAAGPAGDLDPPDPQAHGVVAGHECSTRSSVANGIRKQVSW